MKPRLRSRLLHFLWWSSTLSIGAAAAGGSAQTACYSTPRAALDAIRPGSVLSPVSQGAGYRVTGIQSDPVLGRRWAIVSSCDHTEWPVSAVQISGSDPAAPSQTNRIPMTSVRSIPVVHAGDIVRLWKQEDLLRIEVAGVSEETGGLGKIIRVRLLRRNADDQAIQERFSGIVRGPSDVEMQP
jgi:Chaperone for flagella basal body P-ring formation